MTTETERLPAARGQTGPVTAGTVGRRSFLGVVAALGSGLLFSWARATPGEPASEVAGLVAKQRYTGEAYTKNRMTLLQYSSTPATTWVVYILCGQSNAQGQNTDSSDAIVAAAPVYPANVWMLSGGPIQTGAGSTTMVPAAESVHGGQRETGATSFGMHLYKILHATLGVSPNILVAVTALGSRRYEQLKRGNDTYTNFLQALDNIATAIAAKGGTKIIPVIKWRGGETDADGLPGISRSRYERELMQFEQDIREDVAARLGSFPLLLVDQISFTPNGYDTWDEGVRMAAVSIDGKGVRIRARGAWYQMPMDQSTPSQIIHASCAGQNRVGHLDAIAAANELFGSGHLPFKAVRWWRSSPTRVQIEYACNPSLTGTVAPTLVLDATDDYVKTSTLVTYGFRCRDSNGALAITDVSVAGMIVTIDHAASTGSRFQVAYATERDAGNTTADGNLIGARGALRNDVGYVNHWLGITDYDWAMAQIMDF